VTTTQLFRYAGWSAYTSATATIITFGSVILFFSLGQPFGTINDIASALQVICMMPLALALHRLFRPHGQRLSFLAAALGIGGMVVGGAVQSLLVVGAIPYQQTVPFFPAGGAIGVWLTLISYLTLTSQLLPRGLAWPGFLAGVGYILTVAGFLLGGYQNPVFYVGGLLTVISYPILAIGLGHVFASGSLIEPKLRASGSPH
jgi:hypothetical protein